MSEAGSIYDNIPYVIVSQEHWDALPEYSHTVPTGRYDGKEWKKHHSDGRWTIWRYKLEEDGKWYIETGIPLIENQCPDCGSQMDQPVNIVRWGMLQQSESLFVCPRCGLRINVRER